MFTVCPKCALTLVVTAEDLRVAQGYVRCGRCSSVFNALARLTEERLPVAPTPASTRDTPAPRAADAPERPQLAPSGLDDTAIPENDLISEDALEFDPAKTDVSQVFFEPPPSPQWTAATGTFKAMLAANQEATQNAEETLHPSEPAPEPSPPPSPPEDADADIDLELDPELLASILTADHVPAAALPEPPVPQPPADVPAAAAAVSAAPRAPAPPVAAESEAAEEFEPIAAEDSARALAAPEPVARPYADTQPRRAAPAPAAAPAVEAPAPPAAPPPAPPTPSVERAAQFEAPAAFLRGAPGPRAADEGLRARLLPYAWAAGVVLALALLGAQIVNHYRDELAANSRLNRPLTALYASLGVQLVPRWDLRAYDVRQLGASVDPGSTGLITVRASIKNGAPQPQPLPLLRVTLQDRFGNRIAARDVAPPSYLPHPAPGAAFLSAGQRIDAEMGFVDPGANAVGFEIDACLPTAGGEVTCANDAAAR